MAVGGGGERKPKQRHSHHIIRTNKQKNKVLISVQLQSVSTRLALTNRLEKIWPPRKRVLWKKKSVFSNWKNLSQFGPQWPPLKKFTWKRERKPFFPPISGINQTPVTWCGKNLKGPIHEADTCLRVVATPPARCWPRPLRPPVLFCFFVSF